MEMNQSEPDFSRTKKLLAETIIAMAKVVPVRRISVKAICEKCGL